MACDDRTHTEDIRVFAVVSTAWRYNYNMERGVQHLHFFSTRGRHTFGGASREATL